MGNQQQGGRREQQEEETERAEVGRPTVASNMQLGLFAKQTSANPEDLQNWNLYVTSFYLTQDLFEAAQAKTYNVGNTGSSLANGVFSAGDLVIGVGVVSQTGDTNDPFSTNIYTALDPDGTGVLSGHNQGKRMTPSPTMSPGYYAGVEPEEFVGKRGILYAQLLSNIAFPPCYMRMFNLDDRFETCLPSGTYNKIGFGTRQSCPYVDNLFNQNDPASGDATVDLI